MHCLELRQLGILLDEFGDEFLKKLWCCVGGVEKRIFVSSKELISNGKLATLKRFEC